MKDAVVAQYVREAEPYGAEQFGTWENLQLARRLFARSHRSGWVRHGVRPYERFAAITDRWGKARSLSVLQTRLLEWMLRQPEGTRFTQRQVADSLGVSPSSISRTLSLFEAFGLAWTDRVRGRNGGTRVVKPPFWTWKQRAGKAWERIKHHQFMRDLRWQRWLDRWYRAREQEGKLSA